MLQQIIEQYKANIAYINKEELYKWRAVKWFQDHWDIDTANFPAMLSSSLEKSMNLLSAGMYFARKMIELFAQMEPETVRSMFRVLFDESITLQQRIDSFTKNAELLLEKEKPAATQAKPLVTTRTCKLSASTSLSNTQKNTISTKPVYILQPQRSSGLLTWQKNLLRNCLRSTNCVMTSTHRFCMTFNCFK